MTMTWDYSQFLPPSGGGKTAARARSKLEALGWQPFFAQQAGINDLTATPPVRVAEVHRNGLHVLGDGVDRLIPPGPDATVGDWLLFNQDHPAQSTVLHRKSLFKRRAPGTDRRLQLIAANVDTAFIVSSCNQDFNVARLERYVALAFEADVTPVILLTKADLCDDTTPYVQAASAISQRVIAFTVNALGREPQAKLKDWCKPGRTIAFLGSSGVGKSTLVNALMDGQAVETGAIREDDAKGRHTTTRRQLHFLPNGCAVLDTPGMRELQLTDAQEGKDLAAQWRGTYRRLDQGRDQLAMAGFSSLDDLAAHHLVEIDGWPQAQVGDIAAIQESGEIALGIFGGPQIHVLSLDGLDYVHPASAYRVFRP